MGLDPREGAQESVRPVASRIEWIDAAKGVAIVGVVLFHCSRAGVGLGFDPRLNRITPLLEPLVMPVFFAASGIFAAKILSMSLKDLWGARLERFLYLYLLWCFIERAVLWVSGLIDTDRPPVDWSTFTEALVLPRNGYWFLYALVVYTFLTWCMRGLPARVVVTATGAVSVVALAGMFAMGNDSWEKMLAYCFFFVAGVHGRDVIVTAATRIRPWMPVALVAGYVALGCAVVLSGAQGVPGARFAVCVIGACAGAAVLVTIEGSKLFVALSYLGRKTLPIYLFHFILLAQLTALLTPPIHLSLAGTMVATFGTGPVLIALSLALEPLLTKVPGLFSVPWRSNNAATEPAEGASQRH